MSPNDFGIVIAPADLAGQITSEELDLNETLRSLAASWQEECRDQNISINLDLAADSPKSGADGESIRSVLCALFNYAQTTIKQSGRPGAIGLRTSRRAERVQCSIACASSTDLRGQLLRDFQEASAESPELAVCAEIVQDTGGELYAWRPRLSGRIIITIDLPA